MIECIFQAIKSRRRTIILEHFDYPDVHYSDEIGAVRLSKFTVAFVACLSTRKEFWPIEKLTLDTSPPFRLHQCDERTSCKGNESILLLSVRREAQREQGSRNSAVRVKLVGRMCCITCVGKSLAVLEFRRDSTGARYSSLKLRSTF